MKKLMEIYDTLSVYQQGIVDNLNLNGTGFDIDKHIPVFIKFKNGGPVSDKRYLYYIPVEESEMDNLSEKDMIGEYVMVPVGFDGDFTVGVVTHTISTITKKQFNKEILIENLEKEFIVQPVLICVGQEGLSGSPVGDYFEFIEDEKRKIKLETLIEKRAKVAAKNAHLAGLAEHDPKLKSLLDDYNGVK